MNFWLGILATAFAVALLSAQMRPVALQRNPTDGLPEAHPQSAPSSLMQTNLAQRLQHDFQPIESLSVRLALYHFRRQQINNMVPVAALDSAIEQAFPLQAIELQWLFAGLETYQQWLMQQHKTLLNMTHLEREALLWQQRRALFAEQAEHIWQHERDQLEQQQLALQAKLQHLQQTSQPLEQTLSELQQLLSEPPTATEAISQSAVATVFFSLDSVQRRLADMAAPDRKAAIDRARQQLGISAERRQWLAQRDDKRELRWQRGLDYMLQRQALTQQWQGESLQQRLNQLRQQVFGHEAITIAREEQQGFFRYQRPRYYGRN